MARAIQAGEAGWSRWVGDRIHEDHGHLCAEAASNESPDRVEKSVKDVEGSGPELLRRRLDENEGFRLGRIRKGCRPCQGNGRHRMSCQTIYRDGRLTELFRLRQAARSDSVIC